MEKHVTQHPRAHGAAFSATFALSSTLELKPQRFTRFGAGGAMDQLIVTDVCPLPIHK